MRNDNTRHIEGVEAALQLFLGGVLALGAHFGEVDLVHRERRGGHHVAGAQAAQGGLDAPRGVVDGRIDVDSMVKVGMMTKQSQYDKMYKQEVKNEWLKEAYSDLYSDLNTFNTTTLSSYKMSSKTSPMLASSSASTVATATANAASPPAARPPRRCASP